MAQKYLQCDQIGRFMKLFVSRFLLKLAKMYGDFLGSSKISIFLVKTAVATFGHFLEKFGLLLISTSGHTVARSDLIRIKAKGTICGSASLLHQKNKSLFEFFCPN